MRTWVLGLMLAGAALGEEEAQVVDQGLSALAPSQRAAEQLRRCAELHPDYATLIRYGTSAKGRELLALRVTVQAGEAAGPLVAVVADLSHGGLVEAQRAALEGELRALVLGDQGDSSEAQPRQDRLWILSPDPDRLDGVADAGRPWPEGDFPAGWDPWCRGMRAGPYPYSTPEAASLGRLLEGQSALAGLVIVGPGERSKAGPGGASEPGPGSLERLAREAWGLDVQRSGGALGQALGRIDVERPRLAIELGEQRPLGGGRWMVEAVVHNGGGAGLDERGVLPSLELAGGRLIALAAAGEDGVFQVAGATDLLAGLAGRSERRLRIVLEPKGSQPPMLSLLGPRWRTARCELGLAAPAAK